VDELAVFKQAKKNKHSKKVQDYRQRALCVPIKPRPSRIPLQLLLIARRDVEWKFFLPPPDGLYVLAEEWIGLLREQ